VPQTESPRLNDKLDTGEINKILDHEEEERLKMIELIDEEFSKSYKETHL
jgi:hypothetical protein